jgi:hypothetical protein
MAGDTQTHTPTIDFIFLRQESRLKMYVDATLYAHKNIL